MSFATYAPQAFAVGDDGRLTVRTHRLDHAGEVFLGSAGSGQPRIAVIGRSYRREPDVLAMLAAPGAAPPPPPPTARPSRFAGLAAAFEGQTR